MHTRRCTVRALILPILAAAACRETSDSPTSPHAMAPADDVAGAAAPLVFRHVSAGMGEPSHTCGVTTSDQAYCWGFNGQGFPENPYGARGDGTDIFLKTRPSAVAGGLQFRQVSAGHNHGCGVTTDDRAYCWGDNVSGQLGDGSNVGTFRPVAVMGSLRFLVVETGAWHTCALTTAGKAYCWGVNNFAMIGDGTTSNRNRPIAVLGGHTFTQISAGFEHTCAVKSSGEAWCWGANRWGQLGIGVDVGRKARPTKVVGGHQFARISAGGMQQRGTTCAVTTANKAYCWGDGSAGQRGDGTQGEKQYTPKAVAGTNLFNRITVGFDHACALSTTNRAWCWGQNFFGALGDGTTTPRTRPMRVSGTHAFAQVSAGSRWTCATTTAGTGYCWGDNGGGMLGDGTTQDRLTPTAILGPP
jgi:alpha-tubulin suppressor-like RCC1 family protein